MKTLVLKANTELYRYDITCPPATWNNEFKNQEYIYDGKAKNMFGGLFFYKYRDLAIETGRAVLTKLSCRFRELWITSCQLRRDVKLLDISQYRNVSSALLDFYRSGINIFTEDFHRYDLKSDPPFSELHNDIVAFNRIVQDRNYFLDRELNGRVNEILKRIGNFFYYNYRLDYFGQCLTDFENGIHFKRILEDINLEGYTFNEAGGIPGSETVCVLSSDYLSEPSKERIQ